MPQTGLDRRAFLTSVGLTALAGAAGSRTPLSAGGGEVSERASAIYDFDTVYNRFGTNRTKWDQQISLRQGQHRRRHGRRRSWTSRLAPSITNAIERARCSTRTGATSTRTGRRIIETVVEWNKRRYGVDDRSRIRW